MPFAATPQKPFGTPAINCDREDEQVIAASQNRYNRSRRASLSPAWAYLATAWARECTWSFS